MDCWIASFGRINRILRGILGSPTVTAVRMGPPIQPPFTPGSLLGGTGRYAGVTGEYEFDWQYVVESEDGNLQGRITGLRGRFRQDVPPPSPERKKSRGKDGSVLEPA